jgi:hypothetical protein
VLVQYVAAALQLGPHFEPYGYCVFVFTVAAASQVMLVESEPWLRGSIPFKSCDWLDWGMHGKQVLNVITINV